MKIGLNLYSIRKSIQDEQGFLDTCKKLKAMGYEKLHYSGAPFDVPMLKRITEQENMPIVLTHTPEKRLLEELDTVLEEHAQVGCRYVGIGMMPVPDMKVEESFKEKVAKYEEIAKYMSERGFTFFYHNHHYEMEKLSNGQTRLEYMIENAPHLHFTVDIYWLQYGGANICEYFEQLKGRMECVHLKDFKLEWKEKDLVPRYVACGDGVINMALCIQKGLECGAEHFFVEQDDACDYEDPFFEVEKSIKHIKSLEEI